MLIHVTNARTEGEKVIIDAPAAYGNFNPQFPNLDGSAFDNDARLHSIRRWTFDLSRSGNDAWQEEILFPGIKTSSFTRIDDRYLTLPFRYSYNLLSDPTLPFDATRGGNVPGTVLNAWHRFDHQTMVVDRFGAGACHGLHEPQFVPRRHDAAEGDGYLLGIADNYAESKSELVIADAQHLADGAIARVRLPFRLHMQVHGCWASSRDLPFDFDIDPDFIGGPCV
jgi:carotenoid cleavage dioxygenase-like enzyme